MLDVRYILRTLWSQRGFTFGAMSTFALGIGANLAVFIVCDRVLFRPLTAREPDRLVAIQPVDPLTRQVFFTLPKLLVVEATKHASAIAEVAFAGRSMPYHIAHSNSQPLRLTESSYNLLDVLGVPPHRGRSFTRDDAEARRRLVLLREEVWRSRFGASDHVFAERFVDATGVLQVVGTLPPRFIAPSVNWATASDGLILSGELLNASSANEGVPALIGRLSRGGSIPLAQEQLAALRSRLVATVPGNWRSVEVVVSPLQHGLFWNVRRPLVLLSLGGLLVWLVACLNLGALLATSAHARTSQLAIRQSLGASRRHLYRLTLVEAGFLCAAGTAVALATLWLSIQSIVSRLPPAFQQTAVAELDGRALSYAISLAAAGAMVASIYPFARVLRQSRRDLRNFRMPRRAMFLASQAALGLVLVMAGSFAARSCLDLLFSDLGYEPEGLYVLQLEGGAIAETRRTADHQSVLTSLESNPHLTGVTAADFVPSASEVPNVVRDGEGREVIRRQILANYFSVVQTRVIAGRGLQAGDSPSDVAVVSASVALSMSPDGTPRGAIGQTLRLGSAPRASIVGVVEDTRLRHGQPVRPEVYTLMDQTSLPSAVLLRVKYDDRWVLTALGGVIGDLQGKMGRVRLRSVSDQLEPWLQDPVYYGLLFGAFGMLALILSCIGVLSVVDYDLAMRGPEIAVRIALGARPRHVMSIVLRTAAGPLLLGISAGAAFTYTFSDRFQAVLPHVDTRDPWTYAIVGIGLAAGCLAAVCHLAWTACRPNAVARLRDL